MNLMDFKFRVGALLIPSNKAIGVNGIAAKTFLVIEAVPSGHYRILEDGEEIQTWAQHVAEHYLVELK